MSGSISEWFHVLIWPSASPTTGRLLFSDLTKRDLRRHFLQPYRAGKRVVSRGDIIDLGSLMTVRIIKTTKPKDEALREFHISRNNSISELNRNISGIRFFSFGEGKDEDIQQCGEDVTEYLIKSAPGENGLIGDITNHPWAVGIGTTVIAAAILYLIGMT